MAMWIDVTMSDGTSVYVRASGGYAPDVMNDLKGRAVELMTHAAALGLQVTKALVAMDEADATIDDEEVAE